MKLLSFEYGGHVFSPVGNFSCNPFSEDDNKDKYYVSTSNNVMNINCEWNHEEFYKTAFKVSSIVSDIFLCIGDNQLYVPCMEGLKLFKEYHKKSEL